MRSSGEEHSRRTTNLTWSKNLGSPRLAKLHRAYKLCLSARFYAYMNYCLLFLSFSNMNYRSVYQIQTHIPWKLRRFVRSFAFIKLFSFYTPGFIKQIRFVNISSVLYLLVKSFQLFQVFTFFLEDYIKNRCLFKNTKCKF